MPILLVPVLDFHIFENENEDEKMLPRTWKTCATF